MTNNMLRPLVPSSILDTMFTIDPFEEMVSIFRNPSSLLSDKNNLPIDIVDITDGYEVRVAVAGLDKDNINLSLDGRRLTVTYTKTETKETFYLKECANQSMSRTVVLPVDINEQDVSNATYVNGILKLRIGRNKSPTNIKKILIE